MEARGRIMFFGSANDHHAVEWFQACKAQENNWPVGFLSSEAFEKSPTSRWTPDQAEFLEKRILIFRNYRRSPVGRLIGGWKKASALIWVSLRLRHWSRRNVVAVFHAHGLTHGLVCALAGVNFVLSPQGSDVLVSPKTSPLHKFLATFAISRAISVIANSPKMLSAVAGLGARNCFMSQQGIDARDLLRSGKSHSETLRISSIRALKENYRIIEILRARNELMEEANISFAFPESDDGYVARIASLLSEGDVMLGRLGKKDFHALLADSDVCISVPKSDSSPRSVYEALFSGCVVLSSKSSWINSVPDDLRKRIVVVDLNRRTWFLDGITRARILLQTPFCPSPQTVEYFESSSCARRVISHIESCLEILGE